MTDHKASSSFAAEMTDVSAGGVPYCVVAAKKPGEWIVRAISPFSSFGELRKLVEVAVGTMDPEIEWTCHRYGPWPAYVVYGDGDLPRVSWSSGVFLFPYNGGGKYPVDTYGPAKRLFHDSFKGYNVGLNTEPKEEASV